MFARFILLNNKILDTEKEPDLSDLFLHESFRLEQKIWFCYGKIPLFSENIILLKEQLEITGNQLPESLDNERELRRLSHRLINKNKAFLSGILGITAICNPTKTELIIKVFPVKKRNFELKDKGLLLDYSDQKKYSENKTNKYRFFNLPIWKTSGKKATDLAKNGLIILNENNAIVDCFESNIFFIKENVLITPSPDSGCYLDPVRGKILEAATLTGLKIIEASHILKSKVEEIEEAFLAGESTGMQKITGIGNRRFTHHKTQLINKKLNEIL